MCSRALPVPDMPRPPQSSMCSGVAGKFTWLHSSPNLTPSTVAFISHVPSRSTMLHHAPSFSTHSSTLDPFCRSSGSSFKVQAPSYVWEVVCSFLSWHTLLSLSAEFLAFSRDPQQWERHLSFVPQCVVLTCGLQETECYLAAGLSVPPPNPEIEEDRAGSVPFTSVPGEAPGTWW